MDAPSDTAVAARARRPRLPALDAARALGVVAMVVGHTLDALLSPAARAQPAVVAYWKARGLTAPLFMLVAGWAVTVAIRRSEARGFAIVRGRLPRVLLLLAVGLALRWPGWGLAALEAGDHAVWGHLLAFDALQTIGVAFLGAACVFALGRPEREEKLLFALLVVAAVSFGMRTPDWHPPTLPALALEQVLGGTSPFPIVPWTGYFFAGCLVGLSVGDGSRRAALGMAALGAALVAATCWQGIGTAPPREPALIAFRVGVILLLLAALSAVPPALAARVAPLGRLSLAIYALHVPVVYGWSTVSGLAWRIGPTLGVAQAAGVALVVLGASVTAASLLARGKRGLAPGGWLRRGAERAVGALATALQRASSAR
ncbi:MAG TPA: acyltransferase family protein [Anaeromyxobacteraceae bacterium]|nr:acyltransferase family protein [Anaeromyxobacteraceae bacterium]